MVYLGSEVFEGEGGGQGGPDCGEIGAESVGLCGLRRVSWRGLWAEREGKADHVECGGFGRARAISEGNHLPLGNQTI